MIAPKWQLPALVAVLGFLLWLLSPILSPFVAALLLAWLGNPLVWRLQRAGRSPRTAVLLVFLLTFGLIAIALLVLLPLLWSQLVSLLERLPRLFDWFTNIALPWVSARTGRDLSPLFSRVGATQVVTEHWQEIGDFAKLALGYVGRSGMAILLLVSNLLLLPILSFYFLRDWQPMLRSLHDAVPRRHAATVGRLAAESDDVLGGFLRGQMLVMVMLGAIYAIGLWLVGLDSGLLIGFLAGLVSFVPYLGATFGVVAAVIASLIQHGDIGHLLGVALVFTVGQLIESYILTPKLVGDRIGLHPVAVIFAIMAGGQLFGFIGVLLALPAAAVLNVLFNYLYEERYLKSGLYRTGAEAAPEPPRPDV